MRSRPNKVSKRELRQENRLTRPPRMEGVVKEAGIQPVRKPKAARVVPRAAKKAQGYTERQRKEYQLRSKRH